MRLGSVFLLILSTGGLLGGGSALGQVTPSEADLRRELTQRLDQLATGLEQQAAKGHSTVAALKSSQPADTHSVLKSAAGQGSYISQSVLDAMASPENAAATAVPESSQGYAVAAADDRATALEAYAKNVRGLAEAAKTEPLGQLLTAIEKTYVPDYAQAVIVGSTKSRAALKPFSAPTLQPESPSGLLAFIVGMGPTTVDYPAVAALLYQDAMTGGLSASCTGTLIKPHVVLTAEHCVSQSAPRAVYLQHAGTFEIADIKPYVPYDKYAFPVGDVALIYLKTSVIGITPIELNTKARVPLNTVARIVGYGYHSAGASATAGTADPGSVTQKTGIKIYADVVTGECKDQLANNRKFVCWNYGDENRSTLAGSTCAGDSGGPLFLTSEPWTLAGITAGGVTCKPGDHAADTQVYDYVSWITGQIKKHPVPAAAGPSATFLMLTPTVNDAARFVVASSDRFFNDSPTWSMNFTVPAGLNALRVAVNATASGTPLHLTVDSTGKQRLCDQQTDNTAVSCEFSAPAAGAWKLTVSGLAWQEYQIVATSF